MELGFDEDKNIAYIKLSGMLSSKAILGAFDLAVADKRYKDGIRRLWDFRDADLFSLKSETVISMAQYSSIYPPGINDVKVAFLVSREIEYGLSRMFQMTSESRTPIQVFRVMAETEKWMME